MNNKQSQQSTIISDQCRAQSFFLQKRFYLFLKESFTCSDAKQYCIQIYLCHCNSVYVGRTSQRLEERIRQHVPKFFKNKIKSQKDLSGRQCKSTQNAPISDSAIGQHLSDNKICAKKFDFNWFSILTCAILLCLWERHFTALSPAWWSWQAILNYSNISTKLLADSNILASPEAGRGNCLPYV